MTDLVFGEWTPDQNDTGNPGVIDAKNVVPLTQTSYGPVRALEELYNALDARCQGSGAYRGIDLTIFNVAADATKLYGLQAGVWTDISRLAGGAYNVQSDDFVRFTQFGDLVISTNGTDAPQAYDIGSGGNFAALGGSPQIARDVTTLRDFVFFGGVPNAENRVFWSGINDPDFYTAGTNQSDEQDIPEGGQVQRVIGGEYGTVIMAESVYRFTYVGASSGVFQVDRIHQRIGTCAPGSVAAYGQQIFMLDWNGFQLLSGGEMVPIGDQKLDRYFWGRVNRAFLHRIVSVIDPLTQRYIVAYPTEASTDGTPNELLFFSWTLGRWSRAEINLDYLSPHLSGQSLHTDNVDTVIGDTDATDLSVDNAQFLGLGAASLAAFTTNFKLAGFTGAILENLIETLETQLNANGRFLAREIWPEGSAGAVLSVALGYRNTPNDSVAWTSFSDQNVYGFCPVGIDARYLRARVKAYASDDVSTPSGEWTHLRGLNIKGRAAGRY